MIGFLGVLDVWAARMGKTGLVAAVDRDFAITAPLS
ncbi:hypothetical protein BKA14_002156 [Actinoplanes abujensis]|uniref:Uncharacterized protein n=1 Tax=Paractinoplanes abujensis TaxID=882441 RepID=A0A7W7CNU7_9ACTN|nr:hypothetical protein [Actinoplanes abujensis]